MNEPIYLAALDHPVHDLLWVHKLGYAIPGDGDRRLKHYGKKES